MSTTGKTIRERLLENLAFGPGTATELAASIGAAEQSTRTMLGKLVRARPQQAHIRDWVTGPASARPVAVYGLGGWRGAARPPRQPSCVASRKYRQKQAELRRLKQLGRATWLPGLPVPAACAPVPCGQFLAGVLVAEYPSLTAASKAVGRALSRIHAACNNPAIRVAGFHWKKL